MNLMRHNGIISISEMRRIYDNSASSSFLVETTPKTSAPMYGNGGKKFGPGGDKSISLAQLIMAAKKWYENPENKKRLAFKQRIIPLGGDYLSYLMETPEYYLGELEPSAVTAPLPKKFNGSQEAARRYAEGYLYGAKPVSEAMNQAGQDIFKTVDTVAGFVPGPIGMVDWLGHVGADALNGNWRRVGRDAALAAGMGLGFNLAGKALRPLREAWESLDNIGYNSSIFNDLAYDLSNRGSISLSDIFRYENIPTYYTGYSGYTPTSQSRAGRQFVEDVDEAVKWADARGHARSPKYEEVDVSGLDKNIIGSGAEHHVYQDPNDAGRVLKIGYEAEEDTIEKAVERGLEEAKKVNKIYNMPLSVEGAYYDGVGYRPLYSQQKLAEIPEYISDELAREMDRYARRIDTHPYYWYPDAEKVRPNNIFPENVGPIDYASGIGWFEVRPSVYKDFKPSNIGFTEDGFLMGYDLHKNGGPIHIKPENRGKFTALKKRTGHSASWFKAHGTPAQKKMATFELNARKWKHEHGGIKF